MQKIVPCSLWCPEVCEIAKLEYMKLSGLVGEDLDAVFMFFLRSWELFGSSIFNITVSYVLIIILIIFFFNNNNINNNNNNNNIFLFLKILLYKI